MQILNLHGLNESCYNYNYNMIKSGIDDAEIQIFDLDLKHIKPTAFIHDCMLYEYDIVVANCFGGVYGYIVGGLQCIPTILINPMIPPMNYIDQLGKNYKFKNQLPNIWNQYSGTNKKIHLLLGDNDVTTDPVLTQRSLNYISVNHFEEGHTPVGDMFEYVLVNKIKGLCENS